MNQHDLVILSRTTLPNAKGYCWTFWDGSQQVTTEPRAALVANRSNDDTYQVRGFTADGFQDLIDSSIPGGVKPEPVVLSIRASTDYEVVPFTVDLEATAVQTPGLSFRWKYADGTQFGTTNQATATVNTEQVKIILEAISIDGVIRRADFWLSGQPFSLPEVTAPAIIQKPASIKKYGPAASFATVMNQVLFGVPTSIDGVTPTPDAVLLDGALLPLTPEVVLVKNQAIDLENGVYRLSSANVSWSWSASLAPGRVTLAYDDSGSPVLRFSSVATFNSGSCNIRAYLLGAFAAKRKARLRFNNSTIGGEIVSISDQSSYVDIAFATLDQNNWTPAELQTVTLEGGWYRHESYQLSSLEQGTAVFVAQGAVSGGKYYVIADDGKSSTNGEPLSVTFILNQVSGPGSVAQNSEIMLESSVRDSSGHRLEYQWTFWDGAVVSGIVEPGLAQNSISATKSTSGESPGLKAVILRVQDLENLNRVTTIKSNVYLK